MRLHAQWKKILKKAWSIRLMLLAGVLTGIEVILPLFVDRVPTVPFAVATFTLTMAALVARLVAQPKTLGER